MTNRELIEQLRQAGMDAEAEAFEFDPMTTERNPAPSDFAPPSDPERITRMGEVMGEGIRQAFKDAGHSILKMVEEAEKEIAQARSDAKEICRDADAAGTEHAEHFESILGHARAIAEMAAAVRAKLRGQRE